MHENATVRADALAHLTSRTVFGDCWLIVKGGISNGYGRVDLGDRTTGTHVLAWYLKTGQWPSAGELVCHTCDVRTCWKNDDVGTYEVDGVLYERRGHLWLGTPAANARDCVLKGRKGWSDTHARRLDPSRTARGDRHWTRLYPDRVPRGDQNGARLHQERMARGDRNGMRLHPEVVMRGEQNGFAKATEQIVRELRSRYAAGETISALSRAYGLGRTTIKRIVDCETWRHVE